MLSTTAEKSNVKDIPSHSNIPQVIEDGTMLLKRKEHQTGCSCHFQVEETNMCGSEDKSLDSFVGINDKCQPSLESNGKNSLAVECNSVTIEASSQNIKMEERCKLLTKVLRPNNIHICLSISFVGNIALVIAVALLATKGGKNIENNEENCAIQQLPKEIFENLVCVPCDYLGSNLTVEETLFDVVSSCGYQVCCVKNAAIQKFFLLMLAESHKSQASATLLDSDVHKMLNSWRSRKIGAHLYANVTSLPEKLTWQTNVGFGSAFMNGIILTPESRLQVPQAGFYYIYSAVTFKCRPESTFVNHMIDRQHRGRPNANVQHLLLRKSNECSFNGFYTSFLAGVLKLTSNDEISVSLVDNSLFSVNASPLGNYFGVFLI
ncbi:hypothetical protein CHS0354_032342 [Potamilus streckersoni]|uniref:THD domain-containing protein n=1 Tax=Potamilus streckersoni TaxID=2493646 RepID=A0AAE0TGJ2_9BIVA|nr:hypothetical protein CHS0354_032342 [Potamilus streckersoni]